ncbi:YugN-like family protein [Bacillus sp. PS06]|uniref:YugN-like family protein n=1 Tax=Bacillus sp. PS06 TaxID=2764176 RepID=UPI00177B52B5|nr:YugN-like family protein [Bacillus sp. PS06]MBD8070509.1 YugN-like family protein [Bacillus sp. PS06]
MIPLPSKIEGVTTQLYQLEQQLKPLGYSIGGNWDYDHGYFDYKIDEEEGYQFLRIPFEAIDGQLDSHGVTVQLGRPFLLSHKYQDGIDKEVEIDVLTATTNQFQAPVDADASFPEKHRDLGKALVRELESVLID